MSRMCWNQQTAAFSPPVSAMFRQILLDIDILYCWPTLVLRELCWMQLMAWRCCLHAMRCLPAALSLTTCVQCVLHADASLLSSWALRGPEPCAVIVPAPPGAPAHPTPIVWGQPPAVAPGTPVQPADPHTYGPSSPALGGLSNHGGALTASTLNGLAHHHGTAATHAPHRVPHAHGGARTCATSGRLSHYAGWPHAPSPHGHHAGRDPPPPHGHHDNGRTSAPWDGRSGDGWSPGHQQPSPPLTCPRALTAADAQHPRRGASLQ